MEKVDRGACSGDRNSFSSTDSYPLLEIMGISSDARMSSIAWFSAFLKICLPLKLGFGAS
jgi:hypothetical protein